MKELENGKNMKFYDENEYNMIYEIVPYLTENYEQVKDGPKWLYKVK